VCKRESETGEDGAAGGGEWDVRGPGNPDY
jgi:hypothetical protein